MADTGRTTDQIADNIKRWAEVTGDIDATALGGILIRVLHAAGEGATGAEIVAVIDDATTD